MSLYRLKGTSGELINQAFPLKGSLRIGPGTECEVRLESEQGEAVFATVVLADDGTVQLTRNASDSVLTVNGSQIDEQSLAGGDEIRVGQCRFILQAPGLRPERVLVGKAVQPRRFWPWWLAASLIAAGGALAWQQGWLVNLFA